MSHRKNILSSQSTPIRLSLIKSLAPLVPAMLLIWLVAWRPAGKAPRELLEGKSDAQVSIDSKTIKQAIHSGTDYLTRHVLTDGRFVYSINLDTNLALEDRYNILRHAGTIYAFGNFDDEVSDTVSKETVSRTGAFLRSQIATVEGFPGTKAIWSRVATGEETEFDEAKLGGTGLGLVALLTEEQIHPGATDPQTLRELGKFLLAMQRTDGSFYSKYIPDNGGFDSWVSLYYPGEAALGLVMLYKYDQDERWLTAATKAMSYLARERRSQDSVPHDHWALLATARLMKHQQMGQNAELREELFEHTTQICEAIVQSQQPFLDHPLLSGSFDSEGRTTPCATRMEGLLAALTYLPDKHDDLRERMKAACDHGIAFLLRSQIQEGEGKGGFPRSILGNPRYSDWGGNNRDPRWTEIRIDYVQHAISALLQYNELFLTDGS
jgi:hypothetical protein